MDNVDLSILIVLHIFTYMLKLFLVDLQCSFNFRGDFDIPGCN